jgi:hypothetical protein
LLGCGPSTKTPSKQYADCENGDRDKSHTVSKGLGPGENTPKESVRISIAKNRGAIPLEFPEPVKVAAHKVGSHARSDVVADSDRRHFWNEFAHVVLSQLMYAIRSSNQEVQLWARFAKIRVVQANHLSRNERQAVFWR